MFPHSGGYGGGHQGQFPSGYNDPHHPIPGENTDGYFDRMRSLPPGQPRMEAAQGYQRYGGMTAHAVAQASDHTRAAQDQNSTTSAFNQVIQEPVLTPWTVPNVSPAVLPPFMPGQAVAPPPPVPIFPGMQNPQHIPVQPARRPNSYPAGMAAGMTPARLGNAGRPAPQSQLRPAAPSQYAGSVTGSVRPSNRLAGGAPAFTPGLSTTSLTSGVATPRGGVPLATPRPPSIHPGAAIRPGAPLQRTSSGRSSTTATRPVTPQGGVPLHPRKPMMGALAGSPLRSGSTTPRLAATGIPGGSLATAARGRPVLSAPTKIRSVSANALPKTVGIMPIGTKGKAPVKAPVSSTIRSASMGARPRTTNAITKTSTVPALRTPRPATRGVAMPIRGASTAARAGTRADGTMGTRVLSSGSATRGMSGVTRGGVSRGGASRGGGRGGGGAKRGGRKR